MTTDETGGKGLDFSEAAARKAAIAETCQHPLTIGPPIITGVTALGLTMFSIVSAPFAVAIVFGGLLAGATNWAMQYRKGSYIQKYYDDIREEFRRIKEEKILKLTADLKKYKCKRGVIQVEQLEDRFQSVAEVFRRVLSESELTFSRFMGTVDQIYRSALNNLENIVVLLMNIDDIDPADITRRLEILKGKASRTAAEEKTLGALQKQINVYDETQEKIEEYLAWNEEALATMDQTGQIALNVA